MGKPTDKAVLTYLNSESGDQAIKKFDNKAVEGLICRVKPYFSKNESERPRMSPSYVNKKSFHNFFKACTLVRGLIYLKK